LEKEELDSEARFRMLETIRQYAEFKLFASEEVEEVKNCHRDWFMQLAENAEPRLRTGEQLLWLNRLEMEHDNLRAAMKWSIEQKHVEQALRIPSALAYFWQIHGLEEEGRQWLNQALTLESQNPERKDPYAWATAMVGLFSLSYPDLQKYKSRLEEARDIFRESGNIFKVGQTLYYLAYIPHLAGEFETAKSTYQEGLNIYQTINDGWGMGECLHCMAHVVEQQEKIEESYALYSKSMELLKQSGDHFSLFHPAGDTAVLAQDKGELNTAKRILEESIEAFKQLKNREWISISINRLTEVLYEQGEYRDAREMTELNLDFQRETNNPDQLSWCIELKGKIELAEGNVSLAHSFFREALTVSEKINNQFSIGFLKAVLGLIECYQGNYVLGKEMIEIGIEKVRKEYAPKASHLLPYRSRALWLENDIQGAARSYRDTIKELRNNCVFIRIPECLEGLGKIAVTQNDLERAARLFGAAETMREKMGTPIPPLQRSDYDTHVRLLRQQLSTANILWNQGREMNAEDAVVEAGEEM
jgi:tetratricopeptide (TPR) repeat protein